MLDSFWGMFFATGDQRIPEEIGYFGIKYSKPDEISGGNVIVDEKVSAAISAIASLNANSQKHLHILRLIVYSHSFLHCLQFHLSRLKVSLFSVKLPQEKYYFDYF